MRPRTLLALLAVVVGLGAFIWLFERDLPSTEDRARQAKKLLPFYTDALRVLAISVGDQSLRIERVPIDGGTDEPPGEWRLVEPVAGRADQDRVNELVDLLQGLEKVRTLEDVSAGDVGLDSPRAEVGLELAEGSHVLRLGSPVPASSNAVVDLDGGPPYFVTADSFLDELSRDTDDWRSREALPFVAGDIERVRITSPNAVELERVEDGFRLVAPITDIAGEDQVDGLLDALVGLHIEDFLTEPPESPAPDDSAALDLWIGGRTEPIRVEVGESLAAGETEELRLVRVDEQSFSAKTELASLLGRPASEWQSRRWTDRDVFEIENVSIARPTGELSLHRSEGEWFRGEDRIEYSKASDFLYALTGAEGNALVSGEGIVGAASDVRSDDSAAAKLEITLASTDWTETLRLYAAENGYSAQRDGREVRIRPAAETVGDLLKKLDELEAAPALEALGAGPEESGVPALEE